MITLTLMAGLIVTMFVATAASSLVNALREGQADRIASARRIVF